MHRIPQGWQSEKAKAATPKKPLGCPIKTPSAAQTKQDFLGVAPQNAKGFLRVARQNAWAFLRAAQQDAWAFLRVAVAWVGCCLAWLLHDMFAASPSCLA